MKFTKEELEELYRNQGWNESRLRHSLANKQELTLVNECARDATEGLIFIVAFDQIHEEAYGFEVQICVELAQTKDKFLAYLFIDGKRRPLHKPIELPIRYGFTAQANQLKTAVIGLQYVYNIAGVEGLDYYPDGMASWQ